MMSVFKHGFGLASEYSSQSEAMLKFHNRVTASSKQTASAANPKQASQHTDNPRHTVVKRTRLPAGSCRIPRQNGDGRGRRLGKKTDSHSVCRGLYMKCLIWEDIWGH